MNQETWLAIVAGIMVLVTLGTLPVTIQYWKYLKRKRSKNGREG
jgi:hypothetical protein